MAKKAASKKSTPKKAASKKAAAKKSPAKKASAKTATDKKPAAKKTPAKSKAAAPKKKAPASKKAASKGSGSTSEDPKLSPFLKKQRLHLLELRDHLVDAMAGVAQDNLRSRGEGDSSAFGMHQADAGSDAYDRDFALNLLSQEQDALYEIDEALQRIQNGTYGVCEMSGQPIPEARLEAIPFARLTVECQEKLEREMGGVGARSYGRPTRSLFGLMDSPTGNGDSVDND